MIEYIYREIWLTENRRIEPIGVAENSKVPIKLKVMDMPLSGSTAKAYSYNSKDGEYKKNAVDCSVSANTVTLIPSGGLFLAGHDKLQIQFPVSGGNYITRVLDVSCDPDFSTGGATPEAEDVKSLVEHAEETAAEAARVKASIPADYTTLSNNVNTLKEDLSNYEKTDISWDGTISQAKSVFGTTEIVGTEYLFTAGYVKGLRVVNDEPPTDQTVVFVLNANRQIIYKTSKVLTATDLFIPIDTVFDEDFYILISCKGIKYFNNAAVKANNWCGFLISNYSDYIVGEYFPEFNHPGKIGFAFEVVYNTAFATGIENTKHLKDYSGVKIASMADNAVFGIQNDVVYSHKLSTPVSGCYPCFFDEYERLRFKWLSETWVIIATNTVGEFAALGFSNTNIIFATFNQDGSLKAVDTTYQWVVDSSWANCEIAIAWENEHFFNIYRNGNFVLTWDIRHTLADANTHVFGVGMYSSMSNGVRMQLLPWKPFDGIVHDTVNVLGDSFTDNTRDALGTGTFYFARWYEFAMRICKIGAARNYGYGGTTMSPVVSGANSFYNRMQDMTKNAGCVFVLGGTNDYHNDVPLGAITDTTTDTFYGTLNKMCEYLKDEFYNSKIVFCTPIMRVSPAQGKSLSIPANEQTNNLGFKLEDYANAMLKTCYKWGIPCFDAYHNSGICPQSPTSKNFAWFMNDGIHMKQKGHDQLGKRFGYFAKMFM